MLCDSALYSQENLKLIEDIKWISRVPMTIKRAKELVQSVEIGEIDSEEREKRAALRGCFKSQSESKIMQAV